MPNPFAEIYDDLQIQAAYITSGWSDVEGYLVGIGAPKTTHVVLYFDGANILRLSDMATVGLLTYQEKLVLYPYLQGLFVKAYNATF